MLTNSAPSRKRERERERERERWITMDGWIKVSIYTYLCHLHLMRQDCEASWLNRREYSWRISMRAAEGVLTCSGRSLHYSKADCLQVLKKVVGSASYGNNSHNFSASFSSMVLKSVVTINFSGMWVELGQVCIGWMCMCAPASGWVSSWVRAHIWYAEVEGESGRCVFVKMWGGQCVCEKRGRGREWVGR